MGGSAILPERRATARERSRAGRAYHRAVPAAVIVLVLVVAAVVLAVPLRRLYLDGRSRTAILTYAIVVLALALAVTELRPLARYLLPALFIVYLLPFVTWRGGLDRLLGRRGEEVRVTRPEPRAVEPPRNVTPDEGPQPDSGEADGSPPKAER
jgi:hypothetical protein